MIFNHTEHFSEIYGFKKPLDLEYFGVFINSIKCCEDEFLKAFSEYSPTKLDDNFYIFRQEFKIGISTHDLAINGGIYIQDYSSYLCAKALNVSSSDIILDMCAAPGGKSINLANFSGNCENLSSNELNSKRFHKLKTILANYGVKAKTYNHDGILIGRKTPERFSKILLDAPCSTFMHDFSIEKSHKEIKQIATTQKKLLNSALTALQVGGELVYSTCTHNFYENEAVIFNALNSKFGVELLDISLPCEYLQGLSNYDEKYSDDRLTKTYRIKPTNTHSGFFIAKLRKIK